MYSGMNIHCNFNLQVRVSEYTNSSLLLLLAKFFSFLPKKGGHARK